MFTVRSVPCYSGVSSPMPLRSYWQPEHLVDSSSGLPRTLLSLYQSKNKAAVPGSPARSLRVTCAQSQGHLGAVSGSPACSLRVTCVQPQGHLRAASGSPAVSGSPACSLGVTRSIKVTRSLKVTCVQSQGHLYAVSGSPACSLRVTCILAERGKKQSNLQSVYSVTTSYRTCSWLSNHNYWHSTF